MSRSYFFGGFLFGTMWKIVEKQLFFLVNMARKGKYHKGMVGLGSIKLKSFCSDLQTESLQCF